MKHKRSAYPDGLFTGSSDTNHAEVGTELFTCVVCREPKTRESYGIKRAKRARQIAAGYGWGSGTMPMPGTPKRSAPGWMR